MSCVFALIALLFCENPCVSDGRDVIVNCEVLASDGSPMVAFVVSLETQYGIFEGMSNSEGECSIDCIVDTTDDWGMAGVFVTIRNDQPDPEAALQAALVQLQQNALPAKMRIPFVSTESVYSIVIQGVEAIQIAGRLLDENSDPVQGSVGRINGRLTATSSEDGLFTLDGVPKGEVTWLVLKSKAQPWRTLVPLSAAETLMDFSVGDVSLTVPVDEGEVGVVLTNSTGVVHSTSNRGFGPALVRSDGAVVVEAHTILLDGSVVFGWEETSTISVPEGVYYVIPGACLWSEEIGSVLKRIAVSDPDLDTLQTIEVVAGVQTIGQIDVKAQLQTIWDWD